MNKANVILSKIEKLEDELEEELTTFIRINGKAQKIVDDYQLGAGRCSTREGKSKWFGVKPVPVICVSEAYK